MDANGVINKLCRGDKIFQRGPYISNIFFRRSKYFDIFGPGGTKILYGGPIFRDR